MTPKQIEILQISLADPTCPDVQVRNRVSLFRPVSDAELLRMQLQLGEPSFVAAKIREHRERTTYIYD